MKTTIRRLLAGVGLVSAGRLEQLGRESQQVLSKIASLEARIAKLQADAATWKQRHDEVAAKLRESKEATISAEAEIARLRGGAEHAKARAAEWKARADALEEDKRNLRTRLDEVQRAATTTQEYVMATEAKLDVIEAAIQVLDSRTRDAAVTR